jgi:hypothetical protein
VFIRPSSRNAVVDAHLRWERAVRRDLNLQGELKGADLTGRWIRAFVDEVLRSTATAVGYLAFAVDVDDASETAMDVQREIFAAGYARWAQLVMDRSSGSEAPFAATLDQTASWIRRVPRIPFLKLMTLARVVPEVVEMAVATSILGDFDEELDRLAVIIDRGYVKSDVLFRWQDVLRSAFIGYSRTHPLPLLDTWDANHPFLATFVAQNRGDERGMVMTGAFRDMIDFHDSKSTPEVRIADVVAAVVRRVEVNRERLESYTDLRAMSLCGASYKQLEWTPNVPTTDWDPYTNPEPPSPHIS